MRSGRSSAGHESPISWLLLLVDRRRSEPVEGDIATDDVVTGDRLVVDRTMDVGRGERVAVWRRDPGVEDVVGWPDGDDDGVTGSVGRFEDELGENAVRFSD